MTEDVRLETRRVKCTRYACHDGMVGGMGADWPCEVCGGTGFVPASSDADVGELERLADDINVDWAVRAGIRQSLPIIRRLLSSLQAAEARIAELESGWQIEAARRTVALLPVSDDDPLFDALGGTHLREMLAKMEANPIGFAGAKGGRWLGWMQAVVVARTRATLDDMKALNVACKADAPTLPSALASAHTRGFEECREAAAKWHDDQAANAKRRYEELDRYSDDHEERQGWRSWKDTNDRHRSYAASIRQLKPQHEKGTSV